jgi:iron(III) transport system ATP-binding protein
MSELSLRGVGKRFGSVTALTGIDLDAPAGTRTAVVGPSGSGKSTLLRLIAGFEAPDAGAIRIGGSLVADPAGAVPPHRRNVGLVMQDGALFPHLSVLDNIRFGMARGEPAARALELMDLVELDRAMASRQPHELSGGQQQRVALARALVRRPRLMLLDEPFSALDAGLREQMRKATAAILAAAGVTTVLVTHDRDEAMSFADQIVVLRGGRLRQAGPPRAVYLAPADPETAAFLGEAIILDAVVADGVARCALGTVPVDGRRDGPATIMLRPEQIALSRAEPALVNGAAVLGRVLAADFVGPSATVTLGILRPAGAPDALPDATLALRTASLELPAAGATVRLTIRGPAHAFP